MTMIESMVALLTAGGTLAGNRVFPLTAPDLTVRPYVIFQRVNTNDENILLGGSGLSNTRMQLDCYADTYSAVVALSTQIDTLLNGWVIQSISLGAQDLYEVDVKLYRTQSDYSIWHT